MKGNKEYNDIHNNDSDLFQMWEKAGNHLNNQQQLSKEKMESMINKNSKEFTSRIKQLLLADAIFKVILLFGLIIISAFNLANFFVLFTTLICAIIVVFVIKQERYLVEEINEIKEYQGNIRRSIEMELRHYKGNVVRFPLILSVSAFLFYILGSLIYHGIKYEVIRPVEDLQDAIVFIVFLACSFILTFVAYFPFFNNRINQLEDLLTDIDNAELLGEHIKKQNARRRNAKILNSVIVLLGLLMLIFLIMVLR